MRLFRFSTLVALVALVLAACGGTPTATPPTSAPAAEPTAAPAVAPTAAPAAGQPATGEKATVTFWFQPSEGSDTNCFLDTVITPFNEQSSNVMVEAVSQPNVWDATRTAIAGGSGPDIVETPGPSFAFELVQAGQLLPLDELAQQYGWGELFVPWALNLGRVDGKLYSLPTELETLVLYYNKTLFEEKGWKVPQTIDELMALSAQIKEAGVIPFAHANAEWRPTNEWFVGTFFNRVAGPQKVYDALTGKAKWTEPEFVRAIEMLTQLQQQGHFMGGLDRYYTATGNERYAAFGSGEAAMNIEGTWAMGTGEGSMDSFFGEAAGNSNTWDWAPVPGTTPGDQIFDIGIGSTYSINKTARDPQAAAEFLTYMFQPETQARLLAACGTAPAPVRLKADALQGIDPRAAGVYEAMGKASDAGTYGYTTWTFWPPKSDVYIYEEIEKVWAGEMTAQQYLEGLQALFDEELKAGDIPPIPQR
ncbi:MAG TPA: extracellular solute-binding protein [Roseiflexaceae bacterium]|nr:extracellular solute-binding protein [Roseiflexaceae bacterium]